MKNYLGSLGTGFLAGTLILGMGAGAYAQQGPPASQQPMEIPAQYPSQPGQPQGGPQQAPANEAGAARISFIHGDVSTQHNGSNDWAAATLNTPVVSGDHVSTGPNARTEIQLDHGNILRMDGQSTANVVSLARNQMQVQVGQGLVSFDVLKNNDSGAEIDTPNVAIRPQMGEGSYRIQVNSDNETTIDVRRGSAQISTPQGSTTVQHDQRITIQGTAESAQYQVSGAPGRDDWDRWNSDRDHTIESADSWHHTNPNYTGSQDLDSYGHWRDVPDYGQVWFPNDGPDWAPYRDGRWVYEPYYGWTWVSYEQWGWAPYHYGRWFVYGGNWGWWPGPVYAGYDPVWAPAYVSFFGFGGGGWGVGLGFGFGGGFGSIGWLPCGPGDRFFPWYGRGINRVNVVNITNIHNHFDGGMEPLRGGSRGFSNLERASSDARIRGGISSMQSNQFGHERVSMQQSRINANSFHQASLMTGASPVSPSRESFQPTNRQVNPGSIPNRGSNNQHFFSSNARPNSSAQPGGRSATDFNRSGNPAGNMSRNPSVDQGQHGFAPSTTQHGQAIQSPRPGWHTFTPPSGQPQENGNSRGFEGPRGPQQSRGNYSQPSQPSREPQVSSRGGSNNYNGSGNVRPTLNMQQRVVAPRGGSYSGQSPSGGGYGGYRGPSGGGSYSGRPTPSAPSGGGAHGGPSGGTPRGGNSGGGSHGGSSGGGHSPNGHNGH